MRNFGITFMMVVALACAGGTTARADQPFNFDSTAGRLPKTVVPLAYDIALRPDLSTRTTTGSERVRIRVRSATSKIVLNSLELTVTSARLAPGSNALITSDAKAQTTTFTFAKPLAPGTYELRLAFAGKIETEPQGLFVRRYTTASGGKEEMLATQFESTDARRMFPGWDEPSFRATYRLSVTVPREFMAVSNMPIESERVNGAQKVVSFARTPAMSSYLVVLAAGPFATLSTVADGITVRVVAPRDRIEHGRYALDSATKLLAYYDTYYAFKYPLPKLDLIDIPGFPSAMENWGGITFDESFLLFDPKLEPDSAKEHIFQYVAHEMSHQWTGDLVTMDWWSGLWLNESFADWMQTKASDHFNPAWHLWDRVESQVQRAMQTDQKTTTHPVETPVDDETQASASFDEITYKKGGAVIRMMEQYLGEDAFRDGVRSYIRKQAYGNATGADLWANLGAVTGRDVGKLIDPWIATPGVPIVDVSATCAAGRNSLALAQHRFFIEPGGPQSPQLWSIPVGVEVGGKTAYTLLDRATAAADGGACTDVPSVNTGALGYFRVALDPALSTAQIARFSDLSVAERARAIGDTDALMLAGAATPRRFFATVAAVRPDDALTVWSSVLDSLRDLEDLEMAWGDEPDFDAYRRRVLAPVLAHVGWDAATNEDPQTESLRAELISSLGAAGDKAVIAEAQKRFSAFEANPQTLAPALRKPVFDIVGTYADAATWSQLHALFAASKTPVEGRAYATALWRARDAQLAAKNLAMATDGEITTEYGSDFALYDTVIVARLGRHPEAAWTCFKAHQSDIAAKLAVFERPVVLSKITPLFWNAAPVAELDAVIDAMGLPPKLAARAKHAADLRLAERERIVPLVNAAISRGPQAF